MAGLKSSSAAVDTVFNAATFGSIPARRHREHLAPLC
jgi:hypothetical protein